VTYKKNCKKVDRPRKGKKKPGPRGSNWERETPINCFANFGAATGKNIEASKGRGVKPEKSAGEGHGASSSSRLFGSAIKKEKKKKTKKRREDPFSPGLWSCQLNTAAEWTDVRLKSSTVAWAGPEFDAVAGGRD